MKGTDLPFLLKTHIVKKFGRAESHISGGFDFDNDKKQSISLKLRPL
jgi:hypothetical protein